MDLCSNITVPSTIPPCDTSRSRRLIFPDKLPVYSKEGEQIGFVTNPNYDEKWGIQWMEAVPDRVVHIRLQPQYEGMKLVSLICEFVF